MKKKIFSILFALVLVFSLSLVTAVPAAADDPPASPAPQMEEILSLGVISGNTWNVLTGTVEFVFDFQDAENDLSWLELDFGPDPYGGVNREQVGFLAVEGVGASPEELALWAGVGIVPSYNVAEEKWTISIDTNATMSVELAGLAIPWAPQVGDPLFPDGLFHWYIVVHDEDGNKWGSMYEVPDYSHYVCYFHSIQSAIDATTTDAGDTINVAAGTYTDDIWNSSLGTPEGYRITKSVTLLGAQAGNDPAGSTDRGGESILVRTNGLPYSLCASDITIDGFMIGSSTPNTGGRLIIAPDADDVTIKNCIIQNTPTTSSGHGVYIYPGAENALIEYNTFYNTAWEAIASGGGGGSAWPGASNAIITHNHISASGQHAIQWMGHAGSGNEISYNHISGIAGKNAIQYWGGPGATISHNVIDGENTMYDGIWLDAAADDSTVSHNQVSDTVYAGINVRGGCTDANIIYNDVSGCGTGIDIVGTVTGIRINFNGIYGNLMGVANYYTTDVIDAEKNWWGDCSGPGGEGPGSGDAVSDDVNYDPWLGQQLCALKAAIAELPDTDFTKPKAASGQRQALLDKIDAVCDQYGDGAYRGAINKLEHDVIKKLEKWISDSGNLIDMVNAEISILQGFLQ
ncbi:MAG: hypothetical protein GH158_03740 [Dehalococcoidia bacterium]|nr:hypothetical protein [Dehalococcoidia bacterium]